jgi:hypothetical protein
MGYYAGPKADHICSHVKFNLRGCTRRADHTGLHGNMHDPYGRSWKDEDGRYVKTYEQWCAMVDNLTGSNGKYSD